MSTKRIFCAGALAAGAFFLQCSGGGSDVELPDVVYDGDASDEALERLWPKIPSAEVSATKAAALTSPADGATIPRDAPPLLTWTLATSARPASGRGGARYARPAWYFGSAIAEAHLPPVTGDVFFVELAIPGEDEPLRLFTTNTGWTPDAASWDRLKAANGPIRVKIYNAYLNRNVVEEGPYTREGSVSFTVGG